MKKLLLSFLTAGTTLVAGAALPPNIVIIMSDDMGYSDIGCYGGEIATPALDSLAAKGLRFTQFYNTARCCPTRASLLTGLYPHQTGIGHMVNDRGVEGYRGDLNRKCVTIAEVLKPQGYATYCVGKWHVTPAPQLDQEPKKHNWPLQRGFDRYYGIINGASSLWDPNSLVRNNDLITIKSDPLYRRDEPYHLTDAISDNAVSFIQEHDEDRPFFLYVAYTAAHWPMHARPRDITKYEGKYDDGYEPVREARLVRMKELGVIAPQANLSPVAKDWSREQYKEWESACMEVYAAMVDQMDQGVGRIVQALKEKGQFDNSLLFFLQDNGGCAEEKGRKPEELTNTQPRANQPTLPPVPGDVRHYDGSVPKQTRDGYPVRAGRVMPGPADTYIAYGKGWANVSNTPFREYKHWVHEGGIATPLIVHWPNGIQAENELCHQPCHLIDLMTTCVEVSGASYPKVYKGEDIRPMEGLSLVPVFARQELEREAIFWEHEGNRAVRVGDWKLVAKKGKPWELYDIVRDRSELNNLTEAQPERVEQLAALWEAYAKRTFVYPSSKKQPAK